MDDISVEDLAQTEAGQALVREALQAAESRRGEQATTKQAEGEFNKLLEEAQSTGDTSAIGEWALRQMAAAQQQGAVDGQVQEGVNAELMGFVQARYGKQVEAMSPADVEKLDAMPLADALAQLEQAKGQTTGEPLTSEDRAEAIARSNVARSEKEAADEAAVREWVTAPAAGMEEELAGPVEEMAE